MTEVSLRLPVLISVWQRGCTFCFQLQDSPFPWFYNVEHTAQCILHGTNLKLFPRQRQSRVQRLAHWEHRGPDLQGLPGCSWVKLNMVIGICCILSDLRTGYISLEFLDLGVSDEKEAT